MTNLLSTDPLIKEYHAFFSPLDWSLVQQRQAQHSTYCGSHRHPITVSIKAFRVRITEGLIYATQFRDFLLTPLLTIELGFELKLDDSADDGFDVERTLPSRFWLGEKPRQLDHSLLQATVRDLQQQLPGLGETVTFDVKHIYAWDKENNERVYVKQGVLQARSATQR